MLLIFSRRIKSIKSNVLKIINANQLDHHIKILMVKKKLILDVKSVIIKENVKTVLMSVYNVNTLRMNNVLIL